MHARSLSCLQGGRALAALAVTAFHLSLMMGEPRYGGHAPLWEVMQYGRLGVDFFFVLSGFVIFHAHHRDIGHSDALPRYLWRRFVRLFPVYWLYTGGFVALVAAGIGQYADLPGSALDWVSTWTLVRLTPAEPPLYVAWTLFHEMAFYAVFALCVLHRTAGLGLLAAWGLACLWMQGHPGDDPGSVRLTYFSVVNLEFLMGVAGCWLAQRLAGGVAPLVLGLLLLSPIRSLWPLDEAMNYLLVGAGFACVLCGLAVMERSRPLRWPSWLLRVGDASYSLYLLHLPLAGVLLKAAVLTGLARLGPPEATGALVLGLTTALSIAAYRWVEAPLLRQLRARAVRWPSGTHRQAPARQAGARSP